MSLLWRDDKYCYPKETSQLSRQREQREGNQITTYRIVERNWVGCEIVLHCRIFSYTCGNTPITRVQNHRDNQYDHLMTLQNRENVYKPWYSLAENFINKIYSLVWVILLLVKQIQGITDICITFIYKRMHFGRM